MAITSQMKYNHNLLTASWLSLVKCNTVTIYLHPYKLLSNKLMLKTLHTNSLLNIFTNEGIKENTIMDFLSSDHDSDNKWFDK